MLLFEHSGCSFFVRGACSAAGFASTDFSAQTSEFFVVLRDALSETFFACGKTFLNFGRVAHGGRERRCSGNGGDWGRY